jgi:glutathione synthase
MDPLELYSRNNGHQEDDVKVEEILQYALTHGIVYGLKPTQTIAGVDSKASVVHAPVTTRPYCIPEDAFRKGVFLAPLINHVMNKIARDYSWLTKTLAITIKSDDFTAKLMEVFETVHREGIRQTYMLGILRSDYMIHSADGDPRNLLQVEINTIASSFGALSTHISNMHRHICRIQHDRLPKNFALDDLANALRGAKTAYESNDQKANEENDRRADSIILMIVQPGERNFSDQCLLQFEVIERKFERCIRCTLEEVYKFGAVRESDGKLIIHGHLVGVVYVSYPCISLLVRYMYL